MQSGLYHHYEREPTSLVSKLWTLGRFNTRHRGHHWRLHDTAARDQLGAGRRQTFPSSFQHFLWMLKSLHFIPFYKENLIFTLWEGENDFFGGGLSLIHPSFSLLNNLDLFWNPMSVHMTWPVSPLHNEFWKILPSSHHHTTQPLGACSSLSWTVPGEGGKCAHVCPCSIVP